MDDEAMSDGGEDDLSPEDYGLFFAIVPNLDLFFVANRTANKWP